MGKLKPGFLPLLNTIEDIFQSLLSNDMVGPVDVTGLTCFFGLPEVAFP